MIKETTEILELVLKIFAVIGGLVAAYVFIRKWYKGYIEKKSRFFTAHWSNEGMIGVKKPTHYIDMNLSCSGKKVSGSFNVRKSGEDQTWHAVTIAGKRFFSTVKCKIKHIKHGEVLDYGTVILKKDPNRDLKWKLKEGVADFFPLETTLYRTLPTIM